MAGVSYEGPLEGDTSFFKWGHLYLYHIRTVLLVSSLKYIPFYRSARILSLLSIHVLAFGPGRVVVLEKEVLHSVRDWPGAEID